MTFPAEILADSPTAYWRLGEVSTTGTTAADASGNSHPMPYLPSGAEPVAGAAGLLVGDTDTAVEWVAGGSIARMVSASYASWQSGASAFSMVARVKPTGLASAKYRTILSRYVGSFANSQFALRIDGTGAGTGKLTLYIFRGGSLFSAQGATTLVNGNTYTVHATWDGTTARVYVDGVLDGSTVNAGAANTGNARMTIGNRNSTSSSDNIGDVDSVWVGTIDEVAWWNSVTLSGARILAHHTAATSLPLVPPNPPAGLAETHTHNTAQLTWTTPTGAAVASYEVRRDGGTPLDVGAVLAYQWTGLTPADTYLLEVRSVNAAGVSAWVGLEVTTDPVPGGVLYGLRIDPDDRAAGVIDACLVERDDAAWSALIPDVANKAVVTWAWVPVTAAAVVPDTVRTPQGLSSVEWNAATPKTAHRDTAVLATTDAGAAAAAEANAGRLADLATLPPQTRGGWSPDGFTWMLWRDPAGLEAFPVLFPAVYLDPTHEGTRALRTAAYVRPLVVSPIPAAWDPTHGSEFTAGQASSVRLVIEDGRPRVEFTLSPTLPVPGNSETTVPLWDAVPGTWDAQAGAWDDYRGGYVIFRWDDPALSPATWDTLEPNQTWYEYRLARGSV